MGQPSRAPLEESHQITDKMTENIFKLILLLELAWPRARDGAPRRHRVTLGPKGRSVVLEKKWGAPTITNDGVSIAKEIRLEDPCRR